jgi:phosphomevalonate kinase
MEPMVQAKKRIEADAAEIRLMSPADYFAMKEKLVREAQIAQAAAIRSALARMIAAGRSAAEPSVMPAAAQT